MLETTSTKPLKVKEELNLQEKSLGSIADTRLGEREASRSACRGDALSSRATVAIAMSGWGRGSPDPDCPRESLRRGTWTSGDGYAPLLRDRRKTKSSGDRRRRNKLSLTSSTKAMRTPSVTRACQTMDQMTGRETTT